jgi:RNA polymerase sigma-70 factor, ECF subfamily
MTFETRPRDRRVTDDHDIATGANASSLTSSLLVRVRSRNAEAWQRLVLIYSPVVYRWCRQWRLEPDEAMDVVQDVFRTVVMAIEGFRRDRAGDSFRGWLRTITRSKVQDFFRAAGRRPTAIGGSDAQRRFAEVVFEQGDDADEAANDTALIVRRALEMVRVEFEDRTWTACWRTTVDGESAADVANAMNMSVGAVYKAKSRVLARLRAELEELIGP